MPSEAFLRELVSRLDHELALEKAPSANLSPSIAGSWGASWGEGRRRTSKVQRFRASFASSLASPTSDRVRCG